MARIRSIHPGFWTDERVVSVSPLARLLFMGIWNECDDQGSFEWSPLKLKMRILPADNADAGELLEELKAAGCIIDYDIDGRKLGAVRNFTTFQRPKKPNSVYPQTPEVRNYTGVKDDQVPNQLPTSGENAPQMEEGGGRGSSEPNGSAPLDPEKVLFDTGVALLASQGKSEGQARSLIGKWRKGGHSAGDIIEMFGAAQRLGIVDIPAWAEARWRSSVVASREVPIV